MILDSDSRLRGSVQVRPRPDPPPRAAPGQGQRLRRNRLRRRGRLGQRASRRRAGPGPEPIHAADRIARPTASRGTFEATAMSLASARRGTRPGSTRRPSPPARQRARGRPGVWGHPREGKPVASSINEDRSWGLGAGGDHGLTSAILCDARRAHRRPPSGPMHRGAVVLPRQLAPRPGPCSPNSRLSLPQGPAHLPAGWLLGYLR